jgi:hypothetical protein
LTGTHHHKSTTTTTTKQTTMPKKKLTAAQKAAKEQDDNYKNRVYNQYIPLSTGYVAFQFRDKWYIQEKKGGLMHPMKDNKEVIKKCILQIEAKQQSGRPHINGKRHDAKNKEELIKHLKDVWFNNGTSLITEVEESSSVFNNGLPKNRIVHYPSHRSRVNYYKSKLIGGNEAVPTAQAVTCSTFPNEISEDIILTKDVGGEIRDDFLRQQPIGLSDSEGDQPPPLYPSPLPWKVYYCSP